jgi:O-antigen/teichoic acid export membrane protein
MMFNIVLQSFRLVFSGPLDTSSVAGKSKERYRRAGRNAITAFIGRVVNIGTGLVTIPLTLNYLGKEQFGLWMTLTGFVGFLTFTDLGLGIGLQNALSECHGKEDKQNPSKYISSTLFVMVLLMFLFVVIALFVLPHLDLARLFKVETELAKKELLLTAQAFLITFGFGLPCGLIQRIYIGYQDGYRADLWLTIGRVVALFGVLICIYFKLGLPLLSAIFMGSPFLLLLIGSIFFFRRHPWLKPSFGDVGYCCLRRIFGTGLTAVGAQVGYVMIYSGPALVIANRLGASAVTSFAVAQKLLGTAAIILTTVVLPLWPAYGEAAARGDWSWVMRTFKRTVLGGFIIQIPIFFLVAIFGRIVIRVWAGQEAVPDWTLLMALNVWYLVAVWNVCSSTILNGLDHMIGQSTYGPILAFAALLTGFFLAPRHGAAGVTISVALIAMLTGGICSGLELLWVLRKRVGNIRIISNSIILSRIIR